MLFLQQQLGHLTRWMYGISGFLLIVMAVVTLVDIASRAVYSASSGAIDFTFIGGIEIVKYSLLISLMMAMPEFVRQSQVIVDLFTDKLPARTHEVMEAIYLFGFALLGAGISWHFYHAIASYQMYGETTQDLLIPIWYFFAVGSFAAAVLCLSAALHGAILLLLGDQVDE